ncbi:MAG: nitrite reductase small subunit NirD [Melioribacteraceae bacterium]|nr:MAG: nitrite reductase small subunit NirD [Melioribacteraceae bacterium]
MTNELDEFVKICKVDDLKESIGKRFLVDDIEVAVFKVNGEVYALSNICPHQHSHLIYEGFVENGIVACPLHGWEFNLKTGNMAEGRKGLDCFKVKIIDNEVYVKVFKKEFNW